METFTIQAIYEKGVLKPRKKLNLPEHSIVEIRIRSARTLKKKTQFASLLGVWEHVSEKETDALQKSLARSRRRSAAKMKKLANSLK